MELFHHRTLFNLLLIDFIRDSKTLKYILSFDLEIFLIYAIKEKTFP